MSLIDPSSRWWNRDSSRRTLAYLLWSVGATLSFVGAWSLTSGEDSALPLWMGIVGSAAPVPLFIAGVFAFQSASREDDFDPRSVFTTMSVYVVAVGLGVFVGRRLSAGETSLTGVLLIGVGFAGVVVTEVLRRRLRARSELRALVERSGIRTMGVVTRAFSYSEDYQPVTRVTVRFVDAAGQERWAKQTVGGSVGRGAHLQVRYLQDRLGEAGAVVISRS